MAKYEFLVINNSFAEAHRANAGDIATVKPHPHNWGLKEIKMGTVIIVESTKTLAEMKAFTGPIWDRAGTKINNLAWEVLTKAEQETYTMFKKGSSSISRANIKTEITDFSDSKAEDTDIIYQPFKSATQLINKFDGQKGHANLTKGDVDTTSVDAGEDVEKSVDIDTKTTFITDNVK